MKKLLFFLLISIHALAQSVQTLNWSGYRPNPVSQTIPLDASWSGAASVKAYTAPGGRLISTLLQPTITREGNTLFVSFTNTAAMTNVTYVTVSTGTTVRYAGYLTLDYSTISITPTSPGSITPTAGIVTAEAVQGLAGLLSAKADASIIVRSVADYPALRLITPASSIIYRIRSKRLAGDFVLDDADNTTPDDGGLCIVTGNGKRLKRILTDNIYYGRWWGLPSGGDDAPKLNALLQTLKTSTDPVTLRLPSGLKLGATTIPVMNGLTLEAEGKRKAVITSIMPIATQWQNGLLIQGETIFRIYQIPLTADIPAGNPVLNVPHSVAVASQVGDICNVSTNKPDAYNTNTYRKGIYKTITDIDTIGNTLTISSPNAYSLSASSDNLLISIYATHKNLTVRNLKINLFAGSRQTGLYFPHTDGALFEDIEVAGNAVIKGTNQETFAGLIAAGNNGLVRRFVGSNFWDNAFQFGYGIQVYGQNWTVEGCEIHHAKHGITAGNNGNVSGKLLFQNNFMYDAMIEAHGTCEDVTIRGNYLYDCGQSTYPNALYARSYRTLIEGNKMWAATIRGAGVGSLAAIPIQEGGVEGTRIINNEFYGFDYAVKGDYQANTVYTQDFAFVNNFVNNPTTTLTAVNVRRMIRGDISGNTIIAGGHGIYVQGVKDSKIQNNNVRYASQGFGGGIFIENDTLGGQVWTNTLINNNTLIALGASATTPIRIKGAHDFLTLKPNRLTGWNSTTTLVQTAECTSCSVIVTEGVDNAGLVAQYVDMGATTAGGYGQLRSNGQRVFSLPNNGLNLAIGPIGVGNFASLTGSGNVWISAQSGGLSGATSTSNNVGIGTFAGNNLTTANESVLLGYSAGSAVTTGGRNVFIGSNAGVGITTSGPSVAIGYRAGIANTAGTANNQFVAVGLSAGVNVTGGNWIALGNNAFNNSNATAGQEFSVGGSIAIGYGAGQWTSKKTLTNGGLFGRDAGVNLSGTSFDNVWLFGRDAGNGLANTSNVAAFGSSAFPLNMTVNGTLSGKVASGTSAPNTSQLPDGYFILWKNTSDGSTKWYYNDGGTIKAGAAFN